jgi:hypothetical protein
MSKNSGEELWRRSASGAHLGLRAPLLPLRAPRAEKPRSAIAPARSSRPHRRPKRMQDVVKRESEANVTEVPQELLIRQPGRAQLQQAPDGLNQHFRAAKRRRSKLQLSTTAILQRAIRASGTSPRRCRGRRHDRGTGDRALPRLRAGPSRPGPDVPAAISRGLNAAANTTTPTAIVRPAGHQRASGETLGPTTTTRHAAATDRSG